MPWLRLVICCSLFFFWSTPAWAHTVALVRPATDSASATELLERLRGELLSVGFEVTVRDRPAEAESSAAVPPAWQRLLAAEGGVDAAINLVGEVAPFAVDVWISDGAHGFHRLARVTVDANTENASKRLAIRASEVLRASLFETHVGTAPKSAARTQPQTGDALSARADRSAGALAAEAGTAEGQPSRRFGFELGAAALASLDGVGPALLPLLRFDWAVQSELVLQATLAGFGTRPSVATTAGDAQVALQYAVFGACYRLDWGHAFRPLGALSLGVLRTAVVGQADLPREGHSVDQWSFLLDASLGAAFELSRRYTVELAGHVQFAEPYVAIQFGDQKVASAGRPNLLMTLTFGAWP